ncbi:hypothetical protein AXF42_Ash013138 [Apostasia shenzhenica]|uniref:Uncharacterized protein n=1 Tax=Apostasia shenzhenica TaxID=1088818 RepID=A0A2I0BD49_9ASPA|nr:hypothetical protein AXF42_Ash013138 [Apostasia shenzhenica]
MDGGAVAVKTAPSPKSPPKYPDFCGRRRLQLEIQILNREVGFLEFQKQNFALSLDLTFCFIGTDRPTS